MANKTLPASTGYFNKKMNDILKKGETKTNPTAKPKVKTKSGK